MKNEKEPVIPTQGAPLPTSWLDYLQDDCVRVPVPKGPRFQADVPDYSPQTKDETLKNYNQDSSRWLDAKAWEPNNTSQVDENTDICSCKTPGSVRCVELHLNEKRKKLQHELGPAFWKWKLGEMGEEAATSWTLGEQKAFESIVKANPTSEGKSFLMPAVESLHSQSRQSIINYYFNVYLPRRISTQIKSGCKTVDTDDEGPVEILKSRISRKRYQADIATSNSSPVAKNCYMTGRR